MSKHLKALLPLLLIASLAACNQSAEDPKTIADKYWQYIQAGNIAEAKKLVSKNSQPTLQTQHNRLKQNTQINSGDATTIVSTTITSIDPNSNYHHSETFNTVLVLQQGQWKVDAEQSQIPLAAEAKAKDEELQQLADELSESMQKNMDSMDNAMNQGIQMLNETLEDGSKEMGESLLLLMNQLNSSMKKSIEQMKKRREQQIQEQKKEQQQSPQPDPRQGEGMI